MMAPWLRGGVWSLTWWSVGCGGADLSLSDGDDGLAEPSADSDDFSGWAGSDDTDAAVDTDAPGGGALGVGQGGAQDFGQLKQILEAGGVPGPATIDDVGFFNEHRIDFPLPECGEDVCVHGRFGTLGNMINGSDCTIVLLGLNTPIDPSELARPPLNLVVAVDTSGSMGGTSIQYAREGLLAMLDELHGEDTISIVDFDTEARVAVEGVAGDDPSLRDAILGLDASGSTNIYGALDLAYEVLDEHASPGSQNRVILLSDGVATAGITAREPMVNLAEAWAASGYTTTTIGMGTEFDVDLMRGLSEAGAGAFYFLQDTEAVTEVFEEELSYFLVPLAEEGELRLDVNPAFLPRNVFGTHQFEIEGNQVIIDIPTLQIAHRTSAGDAEAGRRGGGGAILVELLPAGGQTGGTVGEIGFDYVVPVEGGFVTQAQTVLTPFDVPLSPLEGYFDDTDTQKAFVMLNLYVGFRAAAERAAVNDYAGAQAVLEPLRAAVAAWTVEIPDPDIIDDLRYVDLFITNLQVQAPEVPEEELPPEDEDWIWD